MAMMRPAKALIPLAVFPFVAAHSCRVSPLIPSVDDRQQSPAYSYSTTASAPTVSYRLAAAFAGKYQRFDPRARPLRLPARQLVPPPHPARQAAVQQRAGRVLRHECRPERAHGVRVTDGVGGWEESGVDPADFSHGLCGYMEARARGVRAGTEERLGPVEVLQAGYDDVMADRGVEAGGSTACVAVGRSDGELEVAKYAIPIHPRKRPFYAR